MITHYCIGYYFILLQNHYYVLLHYYNIIITWLLLHYYMIVTSLLHSLLLLINYYPLLHWLFLCIILKKIRKANAWPSYLAVEWNISQYRASSCKKQALKWMEASDLSNVASKNRGCIGKQGDSRLKDEVWTHILYFLRSTKLKGCISYIISTPL